MFKKLFGTIRSLFSTLFGGGDARKPSPARPRPRPEVNADHPQDGSEIQPDTLVVQMDERDPVRIDPQQPDIEFEEDPFGEEEIVVPPVEPPSPEREPEPARTETEEETAIPEPETAPVPEPQPEMPKPAPAHRARFLWCLDNGHGKLTAGKRSPVFEDGETRFFEYEFNRDIVRRISEQLDAKGVSYFNVVPEVEVDNFLAERVARANARSSDLPKIYLSVHSNAAPARSINHWASDGVSGVETWFFHGSKRAQKAAAIFQQHLLDRTGWVNRHIKSKPKGQFYVLRKTKMTAVLTENGFYNNRRQAQELMREDVRQRIADAHVAAILQIEESGL